LGFRIGSSIQAISEEPTVVLLLVLAGLFLVGLFLEGLAAMILIVPIVAPILTSAGVDPLQAGVAIIMMLLVGGVTPPVGVVAMFACKIGGVSYPSTFKIFIPYILTVLTIVLLVVFVPGMTLLLPSMLIP
jgi:TRAP-type C4-dicarboxylate transport system permease large subunit